MLLLLCNQLRLKSNRNALTKIKIENVNKNLMRQLIEIDGETHFMLSDECIRF